MRTESRELLAVGIFGGKSNLGDRIEMLLRRGRTFSPRASAGGVAVSTLVLSGLMLAASLAPRWIAFAQTPSAVPKPQAFDVVSIKPNSSGGDGTDMRSSPGHLTVVNATADELLLYAFGVKDFQLGGKPDWLAKDRFDVDAVTGTSADLNRTTLQPYLQSMFADRFRLKFHREIRDTPVYSLVVAKGGAKLTVHSGEGQPITGIHSSSGKDTVNARKTTMKRLAEVLSEQTDRVVIDNTGLRGEYDFSLAWASDLTVDSQGQSIFSAIQEQLGLKLESAKGPVPFIVIDRVEKPDAN
jgi:uncharacterized protein (TIGR03435 family)